jgi:hypothetical protein
MDKVSKEAEREHRERAFAENAWLTYFNNYLYSHNVITTREYKLMVEKIAQRCAHYSHRRSSR